MHYDRKSQCVSINGESFQDLSSKWIKEYKFGIVKGEYKQIG